MPEEAHTGPGLTTDVPPGKFWRGIIALRQSYVPPAPKFDSVSQFSSSENHPLQQDHPIGPLIAAVADHF